MLDAAQGVAAEGEEFAREVSGQGSRDENRGAERLGQTFDSGGFIYGRANDSEVEPSGGAYVSVGHVAAMQGNPKSARPICTMGASRLWRR